MEENNYIYIIKQNILVFKTSELSISETDSMHKLFYLKQCHGILKTTTTNNNKQSQNKIVNKYKLLEKNSYLKV